MTEKLLYKDLAQHLPEPHWTRIENAAGVGQSDVNCCYKGKEFWLELKIGVPLLRPSQFAWNMRRAKQGGRVYVLSQMADKTLHVWKFPLKVDPNASGLLEVTSKPDKIFRTILLAEELLNYLTM